MNLLIKSQLAPVEDVEELGDSFSGAARGAAVDAADRPSAGVATDGRDAQPGEPATGGDDDLALLNARWPALPASIRAAILALVEAADLRRSGRGVSSPRAKHGELRPLRGTL